MSRCQPMLICLLSGLAIVARGQTGDAEFFERRIRPVLVERCYRCHNSADTAKGGLALDHRAGLRQGGESGPAIVAGDADRSLLIRLIRHDVDGRRMPADDGKLGAAVVADFARWINSGAPDPRDHPPTKDDLETALSWDAVKKRRMTWWSWQPIRSRTSGHPSIDHFIAAGLAANGLAPAPRADAAALLRRVTFALTGLPPSAQAIRAFTADSTARAYRQVVEELLDSPAFGERWARHWMDWLRSADSHGSEGDPTIPNAWRFRDYLIRALNADIPIDQLIREHIAGDLLPSPRVDTARGVNMSRIGASQFRFVQHGFAPTDALEEQVRFIDNQIDVVTKAFLGLTVSCARCHDHKFDAISQNDFHALYGALATGRPASLTIDTPERLTRNRDTLRALKHDIRAALGSAWETALEGLAEKPERLLDLIGKPALENSRHVLHPLAEVQRTQPDGRRSRWRQLAAAWKKSVDRRATTRSALGRPAGAKLEAWLGHGIGVQQKVTSPGEFHVKPEGPRVLDAILPSGIYTHLVSSKHAAVLTSPRLTFDMKAAWVRVRGDQQARTRYVVQGYPRGGTVYPIHGMGGGAERWVRWDLTYWNGEHGYIEATTAADGAVEANVNAARSWFGVADVAFVSDAQQRAGVIPRDEIADHLSPLLKRPSVNLGKPLGDLLNAYVAAIKESIDAWRSGPMTDDQARFMDGLVRAGVLPTQLDDLAALRPLIDRYRSLEQAIPVPRRTPGAIESPIFPQPLFVRGDHKKKGPPVQRRFLESIDDTPYGDDQPARLRLADDFVRADNPFTARVMANRVWHHLFGRGIVATPDNFGHLGAQPTHPELLDDLAERLRSSDWSLKRLVRDIVLSDTFQQSSASLEASDPTNKWFSRFPHRRLEAEAIRDAILAVSGTLDTSSFGPPVAGGSPRRSVYVRVRRNALDPFLTAFDAPPPHTTHGRRNSTNVPAQSLTLMNGRFAAGQARAWANRVLKDGDLQSDDDRVAAMFISAFGRPPDADEQTRCLDFMAAMGRERTTLLEKSRNQQRRREAAEKRIGALTEPIRRRLATTGARPTPPAPKPIAVWEFDGDARDSVGHMHGKLVGSARVEDGALVLDGRGHVETAPLRQPLREKTLEVWVRLSNLDQRGGGAMSLETRGGGVFDSIVFGEKTPRRWLAGSEFFHRTQSFGGTDETVAASRPVHVAMTYDEDGRIRGYVDGRPYGKGYRSAPFVSFAPQQTIALFGLRHSPASNTKRLAGRILRAHLHGRALRPEEVRRSAQATAGWVSEKQILDSMTAKQRALHTQLRDQIKRATEGRAALDIPSDFRIDPRDAWVDLALAFFNMKEFIYIR